MAVYHRAAKLRADLVELVAEVRHLVGGILVAGYDLVDRVDDYRKVISLCGAAYQLRRELVHRHGLAAQVPDVDIPEVLRLPAERVVDVSKSVLAGSLVQLQIDVQNTSLGDFPAEPLAPLRDSRTQLYQRERLARLRGSRDEHFVPLPENSTDKRRRKLRHVVPEIRRVLEAREVVVHALYPFPPLVPARLADVRIDYVLPVLAALYARNPRQPRGITVLRVGL